MKRENLKNGTGITLIALVLTIIILLILAGVSLNLVSGSNGILSRATSAVNATKQAQLEEELQLGLAEIMMDYYIEGNGKTLQEYIIEQCNKPENNGMLEVGNGTFSSIDGELYYTDSNGNISMITVDNNGNVSIEGSVSADGTVNDTNPPSIFATATTNSISLVIKDPLSGIAGWAYSATNEEPTTWNEVSGKPKSFNETITGLTNGTTYYIWAKDANGNKSQVKEVRTKDFDELSYDVTWEGIMATITVKSPSTGVQFKTSETEEWQKYSESNKPSVASNTTVYFQVTDTTNTTTLNSVKPLKKSTITYNANGGTGNLPSAQTAEHTNNVEVDTTTVLTKIGYHFVGWALSNNSTEAITNFEMPNHEVTLYAVLEKHIFDSNDGICTKCNADENYLDANSQSKMNNWTYSCYRDYGGGFRFGWNGSITDMNCFGISGWANATSYDPLGGNICSIVYNNPIEVTNISEIIMNVKMFTNWSTGGNCTSIGLVSSNSNSKYEDFSNFVVAKQIKHSENGSKNYQFKLNVENYVGTYYLKVTVKHDIPETSQQTSVTGFYSLYPIYK